MASHPHGKPNFRNLFWYPFKITGLTVLRTYEFIGKRFSSGYHNTTHPEFIDEGDIVRSEKTKHINDITQHHYTPDRAGTDLTPTIWKPQTISYPYERLEEIEPWLFVPGNYNGRIGIIWETCTCLLYTSPSPRD